MALTDVKIRQAKAATKPIKIRDSNGLYIEVRPSGSKLWRYRYELGGKENVFAIGEYPEVSLQAARTERDAARALVKKGTHPAHARRIELTSSIEVGRETFKAVCDEWLGKMKKLWTLKHYDEVSRMMVADTYPSIGTLPIRTITARHILAVMQRVEERGSPSVASKVRQYISKAFQYAVITQRADADPASVLRGALPADQQARIKEHIEKVLAKTGAQAA